jgi:hypothetical protein
MVKKRTRSRKNRSKARPVKPTVLANNQDPIPIRARKRKGTSKKLPMTRHVRAVCSVTDPFCPASKNSKWPDGTSGNTLTEQFRGTQTLFCDANGAHFSVYQGSAPYGYLNGAIVGSTATTGTNFGIYRASSLMATYGNDYRIVSFGCIIRCIASATSASGVVTLGTSSAGAVSTAYTMGTELYDEVTVKAIQPGLEISWISQPRGPGARDFISQSIITSAPSDWTSLYVEVFGAAASSSPLLVEWFLNVEFNTKTTARALSAIAKPNPPKSSAAESSVSAAHASIGSFIEGGVAMVEQTVMKHATDALQNFIGDPLESLVGLLGL